MVVAVSVRSCGLAYDKRSSLCCAPRCARLTVSLATIPEREGFDDFASRLSEASCRRWSILQLASDTEQCRQVTDSLASDDKLTKHQMIECICEAAPELVLTEGGSVVVSKAVEVATGSDRERVITALAPQMLNMCFSPHGSSVLLDIIEFFPFALLSVFICSLRGHAVEIARHSIASSVLERLIQYGSDKDLAKLFDELEPACLALAMDPIGHAVVEAMLETIGARRRARLLRSILLALPTLAVHASGSLVVLRVLQGRDSEQQAVIEALNSHMSLEELAENQHGRKIVEELHEMSFGDLPSQVA